MLKIRKTQYEELGKVTLKQFEDEMVSHLKKFFPKYYEIYSEPLIRQVIQYGIERAKIYGFLTKRDTPLYIDLMLLLGSHFDEDGQYPWSRQILSDKAIEDPIAKADQLYDRAVKFLDEVSGKENEYLGRALLRIREISLDNYSKDAAANSQARMASLLQEIWPQKYRILGEDIVNELIESSNESTRKYEMSSEQGIVVTAVLKFLLGSGFDTDIQFPWATGVLNDAAIGDVASRVAGLYKSAISFMNKWL